MYEKRLTRSPYWIFTRKEFNPDHIGLNETLFSIGNGYIGARGVLSESPEESYPGTYIAGVYNSMNNEPAEIVNCPNPFRIEIEIEGKPVDYGDMKIREHLRRLDIKKALLYRRTVFEFNKKIYKYETFRFFSMSDIHTGLLLFSISCLTDDSTIKIRHVIDGTTENKLRAENTPIRHFKITEKSGTNKTAYLESRTKDEKYRIGMALHSENASGKGLKSKNIQGKNTCGIEYAIKAEKNRVYSFDSFVSVYTSRERKHIKDSCLKEIRDNKKSGVDKILRKHTWKWRKIWGDCNIEIAGDKTYQLSVRFNAYQLIIASPQEDLDTSIPAKTLSGDWYKGHIFWDTEIYAFPFFNFTQPKVARNLLMYRARRLEAARRGARSQHYKGALWPWESAQTGEDETPDTWRNFDGNEIHVYNKYREHHIAADVIYAVLQYYYLNGDDLFMVRNGLEMILSTARFIASRVNYNDGKKKYEIKNVVGPNEFQEKVDNNSYTNYMAGVVLKNAVEIFRKFKNKYPRKTALLADKIKLEPEEIRLWKEISERLVFLQDKNGLIEEFEGYFKKQDVIIKKHDENGMPVWPAEVDYNEVERTQLVKQADVMLLMCLFSSEFTSEAKKLNYDYYIKRTTHKSSLSVPIYMIMALDIGLLDDYEPFFEQVFNADLKNIHENTDHGIHAASLGGAWQVIANGFAGISIKNNVLHIKPHLPETWKGIKFRIWFQQAQFELNLTKNKTTVTLIRDEKKKPRQFNLKVNDTTMTISGESKKIVV